MFKYFTRLGGVTVEGTEGQAGSRLVVDDAAATPHVNVNLEAEEHTVGLNGEGKLVAGTMTLTGPTLNGSFTGYTIFVNGREQPVFKSGSGGEYYAAYADNADWLVFAQLGLDRNFKSYDYRSEVDLEDNERDDPPASSTSVHVDDIDGNGHSERRREVDLNDDGETIRTRFTVDVNGDDVPEQTRTALFHDGGNLAGKLIRIDLEQDANRDGTMDRFTTSYVYNPVVGNLTSYTIVKDFGGDGIADIAETYLVDSQGRWTSRIYRSDRNGDGILESVSEVSYGYLTTPNTEETIATVTSRVSDGWQLSRGRSSIVREYDLVGAGADQRRLTKRTYDRDDDDVADQVIDYTYDGEARVASRTVAEDWDDDRTVDSIERTTYRYDANGYQTSRSLVRKRTTDDTYDETNGRLAKRVITDRDDDGTLTGIQTVTYSYGPVNGRIRLTSDKAVHTDGAGNQTRITDTAYTYHDNGNKATETVSDDVGVTGNPTVTTTRFNTAGVEIGTSSPSPPRVDGAAGAFGRPFAAVDVGDASIPVFADIDGDGLIDLLAGAKDGTLHHYENTGTIDAPVFTKRTGSDTPFLALDDVGAASAIDVGGRAAPALADVDGDGLIDLVVGEGDGVLNWYENTGSAEAPRFTERPGTDNPFHHIDVGRRSAPALADVDGDGDLDLVVGERSGALNWYRNAGDAETPKFVEQRGTDNPFDGIRVGERSVPILADADGDGDLDLLVGELDGDLNWYENVGTRTKPRFVERTGSDNPFDAFDAEDLSAPALADVNGDGVLDLVVGKGDGGLDHFTRSSGKAAVEAGGRRLVHVTLGSDYEEADADLFDGIDVGARNAPALGDVDGDGDLDLVTGEYRGDLNWHENTGTAWAPEFTERTGGDNPFRGIDVGKRSTPALGDVDGDGDLDLVTGEQDGVLNYHENVGTAGAPEFVERTGSDNPFGGIDVGKRSAPALGDVDGDGDLDLVSGELDGTLNYYENIGTARAPEFTERTGGDNPFDGLDAGNRSNTPILADVDGDGDVDLVSGELDGALNWYENVGTAGALKFTERTGTDGPFDGLDAGETSAPALADLDDDGVLDLVVGERGGGIRHFTRSVERVVTDVFGADGRRIGRTEDTDGDGDPDRFEGGPGNDVLTGSDEADAFVFGLGTGRDTIAGFEDGSDWIEFKGDVVDGFDDLTIDSSGGDAIVSHGDRGDSITLTDVSVDDLTTDDFLFG